LLDGLIAEDDSDELVTARELAAEIDGVSMEYVSQVAKRCKVAPMGFRPVVMQQYYQAIGKTVFRPRPARTYRRGEMP
jgi:hypothetical protein